jgi:uncharacterized membrane protein
MSASDDPFDLDALRAGPELEPLARTAGAVRSRKRRPHFIQVPLLWVERLDGAGGQTYRVALWLLIEGVSRQAKWKALRDLERRGLITVERRSRRSPLVRVLV